MVTVKYGTIEFMTLFLLVMQWNFCLGSGGITVDPPADLHVIDPGLLGRLHIGWALPPSLKNVSGCSVRFQVQYFNTYEDRWITVRTIHQEYHAQFDLEKEVRVKVWTLLRGPCTNGSELLSAPAEVVLQPPDPGTGLKVTGFGCIFHRKEFMECTWEQRRAQPLHAQNFLFYWHNNMVRAMECPTYILSGTERIGCSFPLDTLLEFSNFNICVNGSSADGPLQPAYFSLQIQNHVKPAAVERLALETHPDGNVTVGWSPPEGRIPHRCLEFEVESRQSGVSGKQSERHFTREMMCSFNAVHPSEINCFRVRSRLHWFCADSSFWSEWSLPRCLHGSVEESGIRPADPPQTSGGTITFLLFHGRRTPLMVFLCRG